MNVKGLDGKSYKMQLVSQPKDEPSQYHLRCRALLAALFPFDQRLEELYLPGSDGLTADFYLPSRRLAIEVQGEQHSRFVPFFHRHRLGFMQSQIRDGKKKAWCLLNSILLVELPYDERDDEWATRIKTGPNP